jgi:carbon monoxide dehydrogenase subunit G
MNFDNSFTVAVPPADVWRVLMDFERVAPCMPGAELTEKAGDNVFKVQVRVKVGPMSMTYRGRAEIIDRDDAAMTAKMRVEAREARGQGSANAVVQMKVGEEGAGTRATMATELRLSGRAAAMGRGVITDVSNALVSEFADNLARMLSGTSGDGSGGDTHSHVSRLREFAFGPVGCRCRSPRSPSGRPRSSSSPSASLFGSSSGRRAARAERGRAPPP